MKSSTLGINGALLSAVASTTMKDLEKETTNFDHGVQLYVCIFGGTQDVTDETNLVSVVVDLEHIS